MSILETAKHERKITERLTRDIVGWLTTIGAKSKTPHPSVLWFLWTGSQILILTEPAKPKLRNIAENPRVAFHLQSQTLGEEFVVFTGDAVHDASGPTEAEWSAFATKYAVWFDGIGHTPATFRATWSEAIRITPTSVRELF